MKTLLWLVLMLVPAAAQGEPRRMSVDDEREMERLLDQMKGEPEVRGKAERAYYELVNDYVFAGLHTLYAAKDVQITYVDFIEEHKMGSDGGTGLHVVKRFDDGDYTVIVNEHWPLEPSEQVITLPNEIRVRIRLLRHTPPEGRAKPGSDRDYVSARYRIAWGFHTGAELFIEPRYDAAGRRLQRRKSLLPTTCVSCHHKSNPFRRKLAHNGVPVDFEVNVQPHHFIKENIATSIGVRKLGAVLGEDHGILKQLVNKLDYVTTIPGQNYIFSNQIGKVPEYLPEDLKYNPSVFLPGRVPAQLGAYGKRVPGQKRKGFYLEAVHRVEVVNFGRYDFWVNPFESITEVFPY